MTRIAALACAGGMAVLTTGCASITNETTHPMRIDALQAGAPVRGADCQLTNDYGQVKFRSGDTVQVRRSGKDLDLRCSAPDKGDASGRAISRANGGMWGNVLLGGGIGAVIDHNKGTAYTYPTWVQLVFGQELVFDRRDEKEGLPVAGRGPGGSEPVAAPASAPTPTAPAAATAATPVSDAR